MRRIQRKLDELLEEDHISGYNHFFVASNGNPNTLIINNLHETNDYLSEVIKELNSQNYFEKDNLFQIRSNESATRWKGEYRIRDDNGVLYPHLKIRRGGFYLNLEEINHKTLKEAGFVEEDITSMIGETKGYEISLSSSNLKKMRNLAKTFLEKGNIRSKNHWRDAYNKPFICIKGINKIRGFEEAQIYSIFRDKEEFNFLSRKNKPILIERLLEQNLMIESCLINENILE